MTRIAIYARYSSDNQSDASIEDQVRLCRERASAEKWTEINVYSDHAISGASLMRPGIQQLMLDATQGKFELVLAESLDRLSRDQEDVAGVYKRLEFSGVKIHTLSEGEINHLHIGLKGTMNAMFLKDLADKTRRGLRGRVEKGKSGGGIVYGYDVAKRVDGEGNYAKGEREINEFEAEVVRRIFRDYARGVSPRTIAKTLNEKGIFAPSGGEWGASTIYGNRARGTGILNNELYVGRLVWNKLRYIKDPKSGKRVSRLNPEDKWITKDVPDLRIVDQELWDQVKRVQGDYAKNETPLWTRHRPTYILSHLVKCGCCGGGYAMAGKKRLACSTSRNKGTCDNRLTIERVELERAVLTALQTHLMDDHLTAEFCDEYTQRVNEMRREHNRSRARYEKELQKLERERKQIVDSICEGVPAEVVRDRAVYVQARKEELTKLLEDQKEQQIVFHPAMSGRYQNEIRNLIAALDDQEGRVEAATLLRSLIDRIVLTPSDDGENLTVDLVGDLAGILSIATNRDRRSVEDDLSKLQPVQQAESDEDRGFDTSDGDGFGRQASMVAGKRSTQDLQQASMVAGGCSTQNLSPNEKGPGRDQSQRQASMVAGARNHRYRHSLHVHV